MTDLGNLDANFIGRFDDPHNTIGLSFAALLNLALESVSDAASLGFGSMSKLISHSAFSGNFATIDSRPDGSNLFQTDFLAYEVIVELSSTSAATAIAAIMRTAGVDYATTNQLNRRLEMNGATPGYSNSTTGASLFAGRANGAGGGSSRFTILAPQAAQFTRLMGTSHDAAISQNFWNNIPVNNQFTGLKIKLDGVVTGTGFVTIYGLRK